MRVVLLVLLLFSFAGSYAQNPTPWFNKLTVANGLPDNQLTCSLQDRQGYIWMGTLNGLVRYDGYTTVAYTIPDDNDVPVSVCNVANFYEDNDGTIWVNIFDEGLYWFNRKKNAFIKLHCRSTGADGLSMDNLDYWAPASRPGFYWVIAEDAGKNTRYIALLDTLQHSMEVYSRQGTGRHFMPVDSAYGLVKDKRGNIWAATDSALYKYDDNTQAFKPYWAQQGEDRSWFFEDIFLDPADTNAIWLITKDSVSEAIGPAFRYNTQTGVCKKFMHSSSDASSLPGACDAIFTDAKKRLWFASGNNIALYNRQAQNFTRYVLNVAGFDGLAPGDAFKIVSATGGTDGNLWVGGNFDGIFCLNPANGQVSWYKYSYGDAGSFAPSNVAKVFFDRTGILWALTETDGAVFINPGKSFFKPIDIMPPKQMQAGKNDGQGNFAVGRGKDSSLYVSGPGGFFTWNSYHNTFNRISLQNTRAEKQVSTAYRDDDGLVWISAGGFGLFCYNPLTGGVKNYSNDPRNSNSISSNKISCIAQGADGTIWIGTQDKGVCAFNKATGQFARYPLITNSDDPNDSLLSGYSPVFSLQVDNDGIVWAGTGVRGLVRLDAKTGKFTCLQNRKDGLINVSGVLVDSKGRLWAATFESGLFLVDWKARAYKKYTEKDGLLYKSVKPGGLTEDSTGNIWILTFRGLCRLNPQTGIFTNFTAANGLPNGTVDKILHGPNGQFYLAIENFIVRFSPGQLDKNTVPPTVAVGSVTYHAADNSTGTADTVLYTYGMQNIQLRYNENKVTFNYVAMHFANAPLNQYAYMLQGYDQGWVQAGAQRAATYTNLSPGTYVFMVKAASSDGIWSENSAAITITIYPPWWHTWWAYTLYITAAALGIWAFVYYRSRKLLYDNRMLEQKIELRTAEVMEQKEEIMAQRDNLETTLEELKSTQSQLIQAEKMASLGQLTSGIAHEIQNPLNFVNNFSEVSKELMEEMKEELATGNTGEALAIANDVQQNLEKINQHGKRADAIVRGMMLHSGKSTGRKEATDINALAGEYLRLSYRAIRAKDAGFTAVMHTDFDESVGRINIVPQDIGKVLLNIYNNAFYAVAANKAAQNTTGYEPAIWVSTKKLGDNKVEIKITDNGTGIPANISTKIFQPFFTTKPTGQGTGLGLSITYDIIRAHSGEITVTGKPAEETTFTIVLPG